MKKKHRLCGLVIATALGLVPGSIADAQKPIRIGVSVSRTGTYAAIGPTVYRGQSLCVKQANMAGGVLGRQIDLLVEDDRSEADRAAAIYEKLLGRDKVDAVFPPYSSVLTEAVAEVTEKHGVVLLSCCGSSSTIFKKGRRFVFMMQTPAEVSFEGLIDLAARRGLTTMAVIYEDTLFPRAVAQGAVDLGRRRGLRSVLFEAYPQKTTDFSPLLTRIKTANADVVAAATYFDDAVAITRLMKDLDVNPKMYGLTVGVDLPRFYEILGKRAEFVYGASQWDPVLVTLRAGGLVPVAHRYPGAREFVEAYHKEFPAADLSYQTAQGYAACQILLEAIKRAGSVAGDKVRGVIAKMELNTVYGAFRVNADGVQVAHKMVTFQWQDGRKVVVWPQEIAPGKARFPTPPWNRRP